MDGVFKRVQWQPPWQKETGPRFNIKISSYQYRKSHCGDKTVVRSSYLHNGISYTGKKTSLYWIGAQVQNAPFLISCFQINISYVIRITYYTSVRTKLILDHFTYNWPRAFPFQTVRGHSAEYRTKHDFFFNLSIDYLEKCRWRRRHYSREKLPNVYN